MKKSGCCYCDNKIDGFGVLAFRTELSQIIVFKDQSHEGRMIVAYDKGHVAELKDLEENELNAFMKDVTDIAKCIQKVFNPDRIDYGTFSDELGHLHVHLVPKYKGGFEWNVPYQMNTGNYVSVQECEKIGIQIKKEYDRILLDRKINERIAFVKNQPLESLPTGKYVIDDDSYYMVQEYMSKDEENCKLEAHKKYVDVQMIVSGKEIIKTCALDGLKEKTPYNDEKDVAFYFSNANLKENHLMDGDYMILYPEDAHMPGMKDDISSTVRKVVIKVRI